MLKKFLEDNASAQTEVDALCTAAGEEAVKALRKEQADIMLFVTSDVYPKEIRALAGKVLAGTEQKTSLVTCITMYDMSEEGKKAKAAREATAKAGDTPAQTNELSGDAIMRTEDDMKAAVARLKAVV